MERRLTAIKPECGSAKPESDTTSTWTTLLDRGYRVDAGLIATYPLSHAETARLAQCEPDTPATALPPDINRRVNAALTAFGSQPETAIPAPETRARIPINVRYIERELGQLRLGQLRREGVIGTPLRDVLAELETQLVPAPPSSNTAPTIAPDNAIRIACSMSAI